MVLLQEGESSQVKEIQVLQVNTSIPSTKYYICFAIKLYIPNVTFIDIIK